MVNRSAAVHIDLLATWIDLNQNGSFNLHAWLIKALFLVFGVRDAKFSHIHYFLGDLVFPNKTKLCSEGQWIVTSFITMHNPHFYFRLTPTWFSTQTKQLDNLEKLQSLEKKRTQKLEAESGVFLERKSKSRATRPVKLSSQWPNSKSAHNQHHGARNSQTCANSESHPEETKSWIDRQKPGFTCSPEMRYLMVGGNSVLIYLFVDRRLCWW